MDKHDNPAKTQLLHSPEGVNQMRDEVERFFGLLEEEAEKLPYRFPKSSISTRRNDYLHGGICFEIDGFTLIAQHHIPSSYRTAGAMLSLAIWDIVFDRKDRALDEKGMPMGNFSTDHLLFHTRYAYTVNEKLESSWTEFSGQSDTILTTDELVEFWVTKLVNAATGE